MRDIPHIIFLTYSDTDYAHVKVEYSVDGVNVVPDPLLGSIPLTIDFDQGFYSALSNTNVPLYRYIRFVIKNGPTAETFFGHHLWVLKEQYTGSFVKPNDPLGLTALLLQTRSLIAGAKLDGLLNSTTSFEPVSITQDNALRTAMPGSILFEYHTPDDPPLPDGPAITIDRVLNTEANSLDSGWIPSTAYPGGQEFHIIADQPGVNVYLLNASDDQGNNWNGADVPFITTAGAGIPGTGSATMFGHRYFRVIVENVSGSAVNDITITSMGNQIPPADITISANQPVFTFFPMRLGQMLIRGERSDIPGLTEPVKIDENGFFQVSVGNIQDEVAQNNTFVIDPLTAGTNETRPWDRTLGRATINVLAEVEEASAPFGAIIEFTDADDPNVTPPGANDIVRSVVTTLVPGTPAFSFEPEGQWFRINYTQGATDGAVKVQTVLKGASGSLTQLPLGAQKTLNNKGIVGAMLIEGEDIANPGLTKRVQITKSGFLNTSSADFLREVSLGRVLDHEAITIFSRNPAVGSTFEDIWSVGGVYVYPATADTITISSTSILDDDGNTGARELTVRGLDANYTEIEEVIALDGAVPVVTTNSFLRIRDAFVSRVGSLGENQGTITMLHAGSLTVGRIDPKSNSTQLSHYTVPAGKTAMLVFEQPAAGKGDEVEVQFQSRLEGAEKPFQTVQSQVLTEGSLTNQVFITDPFPEKTDLKWRAKKISAGTADVSVEYRLLLIDNEAV